MECYFIILKGYSENWTFLRLFQISARQLFAFVNNCFRNFGKLTEKPMPNKGRNNAWSSEMTERICHLIGHKYSQFQALSGHFVKKKLKTI